MYKPAAILLNVVVAFTSAAGSDVAMFRGNPQHTGVVADSASPKGGAFINPEWRFQTDGRIRSSAALVNGFVYFGSDDGYLYALKAGDGILVWKLKTGGEVASSPAVANELVYFMSHDGVFRAVDTKCGKVKWTVATEPEFAVSGWMRLVSFVARPVGRKRSLRRGRLRRLRTGLFTPAAWMGRCTHSV